jgi:hypothetical protein
LIDGLAVAIGILVTTIIVHRSLGVHQATIDHLDKQIDSDFKRYDTLNEKAEVRSQASLTKVEIKGLLAKATANSVFIRKCIWWVLVASIVFIGVSSFDVSPAQALN